MISGTSSLEGAIQLLDALQKTLESAGFCLRKCSSNIPAAVQHLPPDLQEVPKAHELHDDNYQTKVLGVRWLPLQDVFTFTVVNDVDPESIKTKRQMLSDIAKLYDPLAFSSCNNFQGLGAPDLDSWRGLGRRGSRSNPQKLALSSKGSSSHLKHFFTQMCVCVFYSFTAHSTVELHVFCNASETAFSAVIYSRVSSTDDSYFVSVVTAKSRVAPVKTLNLSRALQCSSSCKVGAVSYHISS